MAAVIARNSTGSTSNVASYPSSSFTPAADELLCVFAYCPGTTTTNPTLTASANGITFTLVGIQIQTAGGNYGYLWIANQKVGASPSAMTVTVDVTGDNATGCTIYVAALTGMTNVGSAAIKQFVSNEWNANNQPVSGTLAAACSGTDPVIFFNGNGNADATPYDPTSGWNLGAEGPVLASPAQCGIWQYLDSGFTGNQVTLTYSGSGSTRSASFLVEFNPGGGGGGDEDSPQVWGVSRLAA